MRWSRISIDFMMRDMSSLVAVESRVSASAAADKQSVDIYELQRAEEVYKEVSNDLSLWVCLA